MEEELRAVLLVDDGVAGFFAERGAWGLRPQKQPLPAFGMTLVSGRPEVVMAGPLALDFGLIQFDVWAGRYLDARNGRDILEAALGRLAAPFMIDPDFARRGPFGSQGDGPDALNATLIFQASLDARVWRRPAT